MIRFEGVSVTYPGAAAPALRDVDLFLPAGELCLVVGPTGSGKSTLLGAVNGLVPHFTGGLLRGRVTVGGRDTRLCPPRELADLVGVVTQDPLAGCVADTVEEELAYGMEQLALPPDVMRRRVEETLDLLGLAALRHRPLHQLSGGEQQRVAIGAVLTPHPQVLVLDEPTSALDPGAAEEVLAAVTRLVHDLGVTVLMAEHRLERVVQYADSVVLLAGDGTARHGSPQDVLRHAPVAPPVVELGRVAGWDPLPLSVRDARRAAGPLRTRLAGSAVPPAVTPSGVPPTVALAARDLLVRYGAQVAVDVARLELRAGEVVALMGRNGAGKSSLLWELQRGADREVRMVPQTAADLLFSDTVGAECAQADHDLALPAGATAALLAELEPGVGPAGHPRDLSAGQQLALVLAVQLAAAPAVLLLDEPTRGLDYAAKRRLSVVLRRLAAAGRAVVVSTHDVEFVATTTDRVLVLADGDLVTDGPTAQVLAGSPAFAPQVAKVLATEVAPWLTVDQVRTAALLVRS